MKYLYLALSLLAFSVTSYAKNSDSQAIVNVTEYFSSTALERSNLSLQKIRNGELDSQFIVPVESFGLGQSNLTYWYKGKIPKTFLLDSQQYLEIPYALLGKVKIWFRTNQDENIQYKTGVEYPFEARQIEDGNLVFPVPRDLSVEHDIIISVESSSSISFSVLIWEKSAWAKNNLYTHMWYGFFFGCLSVLMIYNLFLSFALKDRSYVYYVCYLLGLAAINAGGAGLLEQYVWFENLGKTERTFQLIIAITMVFDTLFINHFLEIKRYFPKIWNFSRWFMLLIILFALPEYLGFIDDGIVDETLIFLVIMLTNIAVAYYLIVSIVSFKRGMLQARFIILAFSVLLVSYITYRLYTFQIIEYSFFIRHLLEIGTLAEGIFLSLALADRINFLTKQKEKAEKRTIKLNQTVTKRLVQVQEAEREMVSNALHSSVSHSVLVLKQQLKIISQSWSENERPSRESIQLALKRQFDMYDRLLADVRNLSHLLHPHVLKHLGLKKAIESTLAVTFNKRSVDWQTDIGELPYNIEQERSIAIYRTIQECTNIFLYYSNLSELILSMQHKEEMLVINIKGDIAFSGSSESQTSKLELDLVRIRGRLDLFGGTLKSSLNSDCSFSVSLPLA